MRYTGVKDHKTLTKARNELLQAKRIEYESNKDERKSGQYRIIFFNETTGNIPLDEIEKGLEEVSTTGEIPLVEEPLRENIPMSTGNNPLADDGLGEIIPQTRGNFPHSIKTIDPKIVTLSNKTEDINTLSKIDDLTKIESDPLKPDSELIKLINYYESQFGLPWCESVYRRLTMYDSPAELIIYALKLTKLENDKPGTEKKDARYATAILRGWAEKGIKTLELAEQEAKKFYDRKKPGVSRHKRTPYGPDPIPQEFWDAIGITE
jgi:DnaD/phage-associated family protein